MRPPALLMLVAAVCGAQPSLTLTLFSLKEQMPEVRGLFREEPHSRTTTGEIVLRFHGKAHSQGCDDSSQWIFYFSRRENRLVSVTRNLEVPVPLVALLPRSAKPALYKTSSGYPVLRAVMSDGREFIATGARTLKDQVSQVQLIRSSDVARFYPDLQPAE